MTSHVAPCSIDDKDLDDAALWALMDSAAASSLSSKPRKLLPTKHSAHQSPTPVSYHSPPALAFPAKCGKRAHHSPRADSDSGFLRDGEVVQEPVDSGYRPPQPPPPPPPQKVARYCGYEASETSPLPLVRSVQRTPTAQARPSPEAYLSPEISRSAMSSPGYYVQSEEKEAMRHCLNGKFPTVSLFKEYQNAAMAILEKTDYTMISGNPFIKKSGWRKISFYFNLSYEIRDKTIEFDENRNVQRAEFVIRAYMQGGRFSDGWGSCERREKRFSKPNHDIPSTAETRAKNRASQDLLGIGEYRPGASRAP